MAFYAHINESGKVYGISMNGSLIVPIPSYDSSYMGTVYNAETGQFIGIRIILSADKTEIAADGADTATVTASFKNWDGTPADYEKDLVAVVGGVRTIMKKANGAHEIKISGTEVGTKTVTVDTASDPHLMESNTISITLKGAGEQGNSQEEQSSVK
ncbi:hypothetical protein [Paenibacillus ehimensis]|uniref:hypothetical protein n=1 Tax=Paenibacillus ehimensis TaxID=79264 RepID=UPI00047240F8|nr:hypothetical protein [Paenibacillus ehimensis]